MLMLSSDYLSLINYKSISDKALSLFVELLNRASAKDMGLNLIVNNWHQRKWETGISSEKLENIEQSLIIWFELVSQKTYLS